MVRSFAEFSERLLSLRDALLHAREPVHAEAGKESPLSRCKAFIDCTKVLMAKPGGPRSLQLACYSKLRKMHCLINQTLSAPDGLIFALRGPEVRKRHDLTVYKESNGKSTLQNYLNDEGKHYCCEGST